MNSVITVLFCYLQTVQYAHAFFGTRQAPQLAKGDPNYMCAFCRRYRYTAYRQFVRWLKTWLGERGEFVLPSCVVAKMRQTFPMETPTGFKYPKYRQARK